MAGNNSTDQQEGNCNGTRTNCTNFYIEETVIPFIIGVKCVVIIAAVCGNSLVIIAFYKFSSLRTASNVILVSLCTADSFIVVFFIISISKLSLYLSSRDVDMLKSVCMVEAPFSFTLTAVIILHLALISVERFIAIKFSLRYHTIVTYRRALFASIAVWLLAVAVILVFPQALRASYNDAYRHLVHAMHPSYKPKKRLSCGPIPALTNGYLIFLVTTMFVIPLVIILSSYGYIFLVSKKHRKEIRDQGNFPDISTIKREMKGARTLAIVVAVCLLGIVPLLISTSLCFFGKLPDDDHHREIKYFKHIVHALAFCLNAVCGPFIYGWRNEQFRDAFRRLLKCA